MKCKSFSYFSWSPRPRLSFSFYPNYILISGPAGDDGNMNDDDDDDGSGDVGPEGYITFLTVVFLANQLKYVQIQILFPWPSCA